MRAQTLNKSLDSLSCNPSATTQGTRLPSLYRKDQYFGEGNRSVHCPMKPTNLMVFCVVQNRWMCCVGRCCNSSNYISTRASRVGASGLEQSHRQMNVGFPLHRCAQSLQELWHLPIKSFVPNGKEIKPKLQKLTRVLRGDTVVTTLPSFCLRVATSSVFLWTTVCRQRLRYRDNQKQ